MTIKAVSVASATATDSATVTIQAAGPGGSVTGTGFVPSTTATFAGAAATVTLVSPTEVRVTGTTPPGKLGDMVLVVTNPSPNPATRPYLIEVRSYQGDPKVTLADAHRQLRQGTFGPTQESLDHAWGGNHLIIGGAVRGGEVYGTMPTLRLSGPDDAGNRGQFIPTTSLDQYGATLASWFRVGAGDLNTVFPNLVNFTTKTLPFLPAT